MINFGVLGDHWGFLDGLLHYSLVHEILVLHWWDFVDNKFVRTSVEKDVAFSKLRFWLLCLFKDLAFFFDLVEHVVALNLLWLEFLVTPSSFQ